MLHYLLTCLVCFPFYLINPVKPGHTLRLVLKLVMLLMLEKLDLLLHLNKPLLLSQPDSISK